MLLNCETFVEKYLPNGFVEKNVHITKLFCKKWPYVCYLRLLECHNGSMDYVIVMCDTEAKMPTIRKTMKTINVRARRVSITAMISSGALSVKTKKY